MTLIAPLYATTDETAFRIGIFVVCLLAVYGLWTLIRWLLSAPQVSDPWDAQVSAEIAKEDTAALCHRCLTPHDPQVDFCPECGASVGVYTNLLPYPYLFSIGHTLRLGTSGEFRRSPITIAGFIALAFCQYALFVPVYLFVFFKKLLAPPPAEPPSVSQPTQV